MKLAWGLGTRVLGFRKQCPKGLPRQIPYTLNPNALYCVQDGK